MASILVTGAGGVLGTALLRRLADRRATEADDAQTRIIAFAQSGAELNLPNGVELLVGDVRKRSDVDPAVAEVDVVVHAASNSRRPTSVDVEGSRQVAYACTEKNTHLVYPSVVGCDQSSLPYYRAKAEAETMIGAVPGLGFTIARATQFHPTIDALLALPVVPLPAKAEFQPVDSYDFAGRLIGLALVGPSGRVADYGGPEVLSVTELARIRRSVANEVGRVWPLPSVSAFGEATDGIYLSMSEDKGSTRYGQWLETTLRPAA